MVSCAVRSCCSRRNVDKKISSGITFHRFPKDNLRKQEWVKFVNRGSWVPTKYSVLCSKHFEEIYFDKTSQCYIRLRDNAVPSLANMETEKIQSTPGCSEIISESRTDYRISYISESASFFGEDEVTTSRRDKFDAKLSNTLQQEPQQCRKRPADDVKFQLQCKKPEIDHSYSKIPESCPEDESASEDYVKMCLICLQSDQMEPREFLQINNTNSEDEKSYMTKIQEIMNQSLAIDETHVICLQCVDDLEKMIQFKEKITKAFEFWCKDESELNLESNDNDEDDVNNANSSDLEDNESLTKITCNKCNKVFPPDVVIKHNCSQQFSTEKSSLKKDTYQKAFDCEFCGKAFNIQWQLIKHLKICQSNSSKQFGCNLCNKKFTNAYHLREHKVSHTGKRKHTCNMCGNCLPRPSSKHKLMRSHNAKPGDKSKRASFLCSICGKYLPYSNGASRHMRVHLGERRHQCHICLKKFSEASHVKAHLRTHSGERPYGCVICKRTFFSKAGLQRHTKLHVGSKDCAKLAKHRENNIHQKDVIEDELHFMSTDAHGH